VAAPGLASVGLGVSMLRHGTPHSNTEQGTVYPYSILSALISRAVDAARPKNAERVSAFVLSISR
jgi:hypothetical protein